MKRIIAPFAAFVLSLTVSAHAQSGFGLDLSPNLWQNFTNMRSVQALASSEAGIWAATTGGLLFWDQTAQEFERFTNADGLSQNDVRAIGFDNRGRPWLGYTSGVIDIYQSEKRTFKVINDYTGLSILDFFAVGDSMYLALSVGVSLYLIDRDEVKETYKNLGVAFQSDTVRSIFVDGRDLWAATNNGIAQTSLELPNLLDPQSWTTYTTFNGLPSNRVLGFTKFQGRIIAACSNGIAQFENGSWSDVSGNIGNRNVRAVQAATVSGSEVLYAATSNGLFVSTNAGIWQRVGSERAGVTTLVLDRNTIPWLGTSNLGLLEYRGSSNDWLAREPDGPGANNISSIALDRQGNVWCTSSQDRNNIAFMVYDGQRWRNFRVQDSPFFHSDNRHVEVLQNNERWIGTFGRGITVVKGDDLDDLQFSRIDQTGGILSGAAGDPNFVPVTFIKQDAAGNTWVCNYEANNSNVIAVYTPQGNWRYFSTSFLLSSNRVISLEFEQTLTVERVWIGTENNGVVVLDYNGTINDPSDDNLGGTIKQEDGLRDINIRALAQDRLGNMWHGTGGGLYFWFGSGGVTERFGVISENIQTLLVDPADNKWIGTSAGISVLSGNDNFSFAHVTVENSPLVSGFITDLALNSETGEMWIATTNGISKYRTPFTAPREDFSQLTGYPNPFRLGAEGDRFTITNLAQNAQVKIYSVAGQLVRTYVREQVPGAQITWDGRDDQGELVPSGVYLYVAFIEETGASAVGKVAVVRR